MQRKDNRIALMEQQWDRLPCIVASRKQRLVRGGITHREAHALVPNIDK
jgi:hypothetical protein